MLLSSNTVELGGVLEYGIQQVFEGVERTTNEILMVVRGIPFKRQNGQVDHGDGTSNEIATKFNGRHDFR